MNLSIPQKRFIKLAAGGLASVLIGLILGFFFTQYVLIDEIKLARGLSGFFSGMCFVAWRNYEKVRALEQRQAWLINVMNWNVRQLRDHGLDQVMETQQALPDNHQKNVPMQWPWGTHHTEYLGHLDAAARKWWNLYDPSDPTTAPINEIVSDWLQSERNISRERARAIASMLRADGLPTGPRK